MTGVIKGGSVLFVDDEPSIRKLFSTAFTAVGVEFEEAADGNEALAKLEQRAFGAVVIDIIMPDRDGVETIQLIRRRWPQTYIIAMSGGGRIGPDEFLKLAAEVGADRTLTKPFRLSQLMSILVEGPPPKVQA